MEDISILILAGGKSKRMGRDKAFLKLNGITFLEHIIDVFHQYKAKIWISGAKDRYEPFGFPVIEDQPEFINKGPLSGLFSGFSELKSKWIFVISVDSPQIKIEDFLELKNHLKSNKLVLAKDENFVHPLIGFYHKSMLKTIKQNLEQNKLSLKNVYSNEKDSVFVPLKWEHKLTNINTPEDYKNEFMEVKIKFYGELAELIKSMDSMMVSSHTTVGELKNILTQRFPELKNKIYKLALNNAFITDEILITNHSKIDVFPPFAGG